MFLKQFRVKSSTAIKGSDRKKLRSNVAIQFPHLTEDQLGLLIPNKTELLVVKLTSHNGTAVTVYKLQKTPIFFLVDQCLYPTVYTLWEYPNMLGTITTWPPVYNKLSGGADLMLPGVVLRGGVPGEGVPAEGGEVSPEVLGGDLDKGAPCAVNLLGNRAAVAVGKTAMSSAEMLATGMKGKGVVVLHVYEDFLWQLGEKKELPIIPEPDHLQINEVDDTVAIENTNDMDRNEEQNPETSPDTQARPDAPVDDTTQQLQQLDIQKEVVAAVTPEAMDDLFYNCFMCALKVSLKKSDLPILTSKFYKEHIMPFCPADKSLDIRKSSYKKLSKFLAKMHKDEMIKVKEVKEGVDHIIEFDRSHPAVRSYEVPDEATEIYNTHKCSMAAAAGQDEKFVPPVITNLLQLNSNTVAFFKPLGFKKDKVFSIAELREVLIEYVRANNLCDEASRRFVILDPHLHDLIATRGEMLERVTWEELMERCRSKLSEVYSISVCGKPAVVKKGHVQPVSITVQQRASNKKVTLVDNLEMFGIDPSVFSHEVQVNVACSCSVAELPGKTKAAQVVVQGNQTKYIVSLLTGKYQLHQKFIKTADTAKSKKK